MMSGSRSLANVESEATPRRPVVGLVGGLGVGATIHYYRCLAGEFGARGVAAGVLVSHASLDTVFRHISDGALDALAEDLLRHVDALQRAGATFAGIAAVTPHICISQVKLRAGIPVVDLIECIRVELARRSVRRLTILGARHVMQSDLFGSLPEFEVVRVPRDALELVGANYAKIVNAGMVEGSGADIESIRKIAREIVRDEGLDAVVLAGTEFALAFDEGDCGFPALDSARAHLNAIVRRVVEGEPGKRSDRNE
jgi:aspartate racemase